MQNIQLFVTAYTFIVKNQHTPCIHTQSAGMGEKKLYHVCNHWTIELTYIFTIASQLVINKIVTDSQPDFSWSGFTIQVFHSILGQHSLTLATGAIGIRKRRWNDVSLCCKSILSTIRTGKTNLWPTQAELSERTTNWRAFRGNKVRVNSSNDRAKK